MIQSISVLGENTVNNLTATKAQFFVSAGHDSAYFSRRDCNGYAVALHAAEFNCGQFVSSQVLGEIRICPPSLSGVSGHGEAFPFFHDPLLRDLVVRVRFRPIVSRLSREYDTRAVWHAKGHFLTIPDQAFQNPGAYASRIAVAEMTGFVGGDDESNSLSDTLFSVQGSSAIYANGVVDDFVPNDRGNWNPGPTSVEVRASYTEGLRIPFALPRFIIARGNAFAEEVDCSYYGVHTLYGCDDLLVMNWIADVETYYSASGYLFGNVERDITPTIQLVRPCVYDTLAAEGGTPVKSLLKGLLMAEVSSTECPIHVYDNGLDIQPSDSSLWYLLPNVYAKVYTPNSEVTLTNVFSCEMSDSSHPGSNSPGMALRCLSGQDGGDKFVRDSPFLIPGFAATPVSVPDPSLFVARISDKPWFHYEFWGM